MADPRVKAYGIAAGVFALDRLSKWLVESNVSSMDTVQVIPGLFNIVHSENRGDGLRNPERFHQRMANDATGRIVGCGGGIRGRRCCGMRGGWTAIPSGD